MMYSIIDVPQTITAIGMVITALTGLITAIGIFWNTVITKRAGKSAETAVRGAEQAARENQDKLVQIHRLVNGSHMAVLKSNAANARRLAMLTNSEEDLKAARDAERLFEEHMIAEAKSDAEREGRANPIREPEDQHGSPD